MNDITKTGNKRSISITHPNVQDRPTPRSVTVARSVGARAWKRPAAIGYALIIFTFLGLGGWSALAKLDSAVTASGIVAEGTGRKSVQHLEGGIIKEILIREGEHVTAGQVLFRLDPTQAQSNLGLLQNQLDALLAEEARLSCVLGQRLAIVEKQRWYAS